MSKAVKAAGNETLQRRWEDCIKKDTGMAEVNWKKGYGAEKDPIVLTEPVILGNKKSNMYAKHMKKYITHKLFFTDLHVSGSDRVSIKDPVIRLVS